MCTMTVVQSAANSVTLAVAGKVNAGALSEIGRLIADGRQNHKHVVLDLSEVTLLDRAAARFFGETLKQGVSLVNCPLYIQHWICPEFRHESDS